MRKRSWPEKKGFEEGTEGEKRAITVEVIQVGPRLRSEGVACDLIHRVAQQASDKDGAGPGCLRDRDSVSRRVRRCEDDLLMVHLASFKDGPLPC